MCFHEGKVRIGSVQRELQYNSIVELNNSSKIPTRVYNYSGTVIDVIVIRTLSRVSEISSLSWPFCAAVSGGMYSLILLCCCGESERNEAYTAGHVVCGAAYSGCRLPPVPTILHEPRFSGSPAAVEQRVCRSYCKPSLGVVLTELSAFRFAST